MVTDKHGSVRVRHGCRQTVKEAEKKRESDSGRGPWECIFHKGTTLGTKNGYCQKREVEKRITVKRLNKRKTRQEVMELDEMRDK